MLSLWAIITTEYETTRVERQHLTSQTKLNTFHNSQQADDVRTCMMHIHVVLCTYLQSPPAVVLHTISIHMHGLK